MAREYITKHCFLCGENETVKSLYPKTFSDGDLNAAVFSARRVTEHFHYHLVRCENCGLVFSREILSDEDLYELYKESAFTFGSYTDTLRRDYARHLLPHLGAINKGSALEVGCSSGFFLEELKKMGFKEVWGCEPSKEAKAKAHPSVRDQIVSDFFRGKKSFPDKRFDLICSFHTLDHLSDPKAFLDSCRELLNPGGMLYVVTHDTEALQAKILGEKSPIYDVEHIYLFNRPTLKKALEAVGLKPVEVARLKNSYPLDYWLTMLPAPKAVKKSLGSVFKATGLGSVAPAIPAGNIFAIGSLN